MRTAVSRRPHGKLAAPQVILTGMEGLKGICWSGVCGLARGRSDSPAPRLPPALSDWPWQPGRARCGGAGSLETCLAIQSLSGRGWLSPGQRRRRGCNCEPQSCLHTESCSPGKPETKAPIDAPGSCSRFPGFRRHGIYRTSRRQETAHAVLCQRRQGDTEVCRCAHRETSHPGTL